MEELILASLWFFLPAGVANSSASIFRWIPLLKWPIDGRRTYQGIRILGDNKTVRGLVVGMVMSMLMVFVQHKLYLAMPEYCLLNYQEANVFLLGFLLGFGALLGDMTESFFKRQKKIAPGKPWVPWDQIDWIIGGLGLVSLYKILTWQSYLIILAVYGLLHPLTNIIAYGLGLQKNKL